MLRGLLIATIPLLDEFNQLRIGHIYAVAIASAILSAMTEVAEGALVPRLVDSRDLEAANSLLSVNWNIAYILGPPLSGVIINSAGVSAALWVDALSFAFMAFLCFGLPTMQLGWRDTNKPRSGFVRNGMGFGTLRRYPAALTATLCTVAVLFLNGMIEILYPVFAQQELRTGAGGYGLLVGAASVGSFLGVLFGFMLFSGLPPHKRIGFAMLGGAPVFAFLAGTNSTLAAVGLVLVASFLWGPYFVIERSLVQRLVPDDVLGEVWGARMAIGSVGFPLGAAAAGVLLAQGSVTNLILLLVGAHTALGLFALVSRALRDAASVEDQVLGKAHEAVEPV